MSIIYSFLQKRKMHESHHGYIMIFAAYVLSALMLILGSDMFYNIKSAAAGVSETTQEETKEDLTQLDTGIVKLSTQPADTGIINPYGLADSNSDAEVNTNDGSPESGSNDTIWLLGNAMDEETFNKVMKEMDTLPAVKAAADDQENKQENDSDLPVMKNSYNNISANEVAMLERIVQAEAGGEDMKGKILIVNVIMNRVASGRFPHSIKGVIFQKSNGKYQFSPIANERYWAVKISNDTEEAVRRALKGEDYSRGALYFVARKKTNTTSIRWFDEHLDWLFKHGGHEFYKNK